MKTRRQTLSPQGFWLNFCDGEKEDNAEHLRVRARLEHAFARMKNYKILRGYRPRGDGLHHAVQAVAHMHNLALAA